MSIRSDIATARRIIQNGLRARSARDEVRRLTRNRPWPTAANSEIAVYFADSSVNLYQIRQWYAPLAELSKTHPVVIITRAPDAMLRLSAESPVPVVYLGDILDLERFVSEREIAIMFYVNQNSKNFQMLRFGSMWHVFINHGESDKAYMTSNQFKAYDYALVAGQAARDRLGTRLRNYDPASRTLEIGRPQADHFAGALPYTPDERLVVLYAPTWEGDRASMRYGSVDSHGVALVGALLAGDSHRLIYRPHPRTGVVDAAYKAANAQIISAIAVANAADTSAQHIYDDGPDLGWQLAAADVAITDISAMVYDRLATGRPIIVTRPMSTLADIDETGYLQAAEWLLADQAPDILSIMDRVQHSDEAQSNLELWVKHHFGDTSPGAATARFHAAVETMLQRWSLHETPNRG